HAPTHQHHQGKQGNTHRPTLHRPIAAYICLERTMAGSAAEFRRLTPEKPRLRAPDTARPPVQAASIPPCGARTSVRATGPGRAPPGVRFRGADLPGARGRGPDARAPRPAAP